MRYGEMLPVLEREQRMGRHVQALAERPLLAPELRSVWEMWIVLHRTRTLGFGAMNAITLQEMAAYFMLYGYTNPAVRLEYVELIMDLDAYYLRTVQDKAQTQSTPVTDAASQETT